MRSVVYLVKQVDMDAAAVFSRAVYYIFEEQVCDFFLIIILMQPKLIDRSHWIVKQDLRFLLMKHYFFWCAEKLGWSAMRWRGVLLWLLCLAPLGESTDSLSRIWSANLGAETSPLYKWSVTSAGIFVAVALVLSMFLIFEHLAAYNKPEVCHFRCLF